SGERVELPPGKVRPRLPARRVARVAEDAPAALEADEGDERLAQRRLDPEGRDRPLHDGRVRVHEAVHSPETPRRDADDHQHHERRGEEDPPREAHDRPLDEYQAASPAARRFSNASRSPGAMMKYRASG